MENNLIDSKLNQNIEPDFRFEDLFQIQEIQEMQNSFSTATGVASLITSPDGKPITTSANFCRLCNDIIRKTEKGYANCMKSDAIIGGLSECGYTINCCLSGGLWDAGVPIVVGGKHIANWLIGQVRDATQTEEQVRANARNLGTDEETMLEAFREIPVMSCGQFEQVAQAFHNLAKQLSLSAYQNVQQARFITEQKRDQAKIAFLAHHDQLTGLANRTLFSDHFELAAGHALRTGTKLALCVLDLDEFKDINDSHGHPLGDQVLCEVAQRLTAAVRSSDTVCRIGGDEFVILFTDLPNTDAVTSDSIRRINT